MKSHRRRLLRVSIWLTAGGGVAVAGTPAAGPPANPTTRQLIDQLAADQPADRADAQEVLSQMGDPAVAPLTAALDDPRPEVSLRARNALRWIHLLHRPGIDPAILRTTRRYLETSDDQTKLQTLQKLQLMSPSPQAVFVRLFLLEPDESLRKQILQCMDLNLRREIPRLLAEDDLPAVEAVLEARADQNPMEYAADYAAFEQLTGKTDQAVAKLGAESANLSPEQRQGIEIIEAYLGRFAIVRSDLPKPVRIFPDGPGRVMTLVCFSDQSQWDQFQFALGGAGVPGVGDWNRWGIEHCCHRLELKPDALDRPVPDAGSSFVPIPVSNAQVHLLNDEPEVISHIDAGPAVVFSLLVCRGDYHGAMKLLEKNSLKNTGIGRDADRLMQDLGLIAMTGPPSKTETKLSPARRAMEDFKSRHFAAAAVEFAALARDEPSRPAYLYLSGKSAALDGDVAGGNRLMLRAKMIPLGDPAWRFELVRALAEAGLDAEAAEQADFATRTGTWFDLDGTGLIDVYRWQGDRTATAGHWRDAADRYDRAVLARHLIPGSETTPADFLVLPATAHLMHARDWWDRGEKTKSLAELDRYRLYFPVEIGPVIEFVRKLDTAGDRADADPRFEAVWKNLADLCREFPRSPRLNRDIATLAAACGRRTADAVPYAEAADRADPTAESKALVDALRQAAARR